jgi:tetratricopeptide (TPR) repeat protein
MVVSKSYSSLMKAYSRLPTTDYRLLKTFIFSSYLNPATTYIMRYLIALLFLFSFSFTHAQQAAAVDSMKTGLAKAKTLEEKLYWLDFLSRTLMNVDLQQADMYGKQMISLAEESRSRPLMIKAYNSNGLRCSYQEGHKDYSKQAIGFYEQALSIARQNRLNDEAGGTLLRMADVYLSVPDNDKALNYANQGFSLISTLTNDSLKAEGHGVYGDVYLARNDKILALRNYFIARRLADQLKQPALQRKCYLNLSSFYSNISDYDQAIDYYMEANKKLREMKVKNAPYLDAIDINSIGKLYAQKGNHDMAIQYFERSVRMGDSLKFSTLKVPGYTSILNEYLRMNEPQKALEYFNSPSGQALKDYLSKFGYSGVIDQGYAYIYTEVNKYDSAKYYFEKAAPYFENTANYYGQMNYYAQLGSLYRKTGEYQKAITLFLKVKELADKSSQLETAQVAATYLDSLYTTIGDFQQASKYNSIYYQYKDSIETLNKEKEISQVEVAEEQQRVLQYEKDQLEAKRKRYNIQYLAITIGIASLLIILVMMGMFKVSATTIKMIGFFTFLMFFEFIFLIFKKNIASISHGEPWKDLLFMIALAALLLPFHHWLEHKVIHYLTSHNRLTSSGKSIVEKVFRKKKTGS